MNQPDQEQEIDYTMSKDWLRQFVDEGIVDEAAPSYHYSSLDRKAILKTDPEPSIPKQMCASCYTEGWGYVEGYGNRLYCPKCA